MKRASVPDDEKKRKLMVKNRASAWKSVLRKRMYVEGLEKENAALKKENAEMKSEIANYKKMIAEMLGNSTDPHSVTNVSTEHIESTMVGRL